MKGWVKTSLIDYPGLIASVLFTGGCNYRCDACHNPELMNFPNSITIPDSEILAYLKLHIKDYDGVVITGGEPTLYAMLIPLLTELKLLNLKIKIDTNGSNPDVIRFLIDAKLVDYIALDIKGAWHSVSNWTQKSGYQPIKDTLDIIKESMLDYELRSTVYPPFFQEYDLPYIANIVKDAKIYYLQQFNNAGTFNADLVEPFTINRILELQTYFQKFVKTEVRGIQ